MKRSAYIEFLRFFAAITVFLVHILELLAGADKHLSHFLSIMVEFFFMLSGFLMMRHIMEKHDEKEDAFLYTFKKAKGVFTPVLIVHIVQFIVNCIVNKITNLGEILESLWRYRWNFLLLQCAGFTKDPQFDRDYLVGPIWYISALLIAVLLLYTPAKRITKTFIQFICPLVILIVYSYISQQYGHIGVGNEIVAGAVLLAVPRALAGLCAGCLTYYFTKNIVDGEWKITRIYYAISILSSLMIPFCIIYAFVGKDDNAIFMIIPFAIVIIDAFAEITPIAKFFNNTFVGCFNYLGKLSLHVYLTHFAVLIWALNFMQDVSLGLKIVICSIIVAVYSIGLYIIDSRINKQIKNKMECKLYCKVEWRLNNGRKKIERLSSRYVIVLACLYMHRYFS